MMLPVLTAFLLAATAAGQARPTLTVDALFTDHMVLQQRRPVAVSGQGVPGSRVTVTLADQRVVTGVAADGRWRLALAARPADGKHHELAITDDRGHRLVLGDVVFGEVWIVAGQSNMSRPASGEQMRTADHPGIRLFNSSGRTPRRSGLDWTTGWTVCTPESIRSAGDHWRDPKNPDRVTVRAFSEVGYVFGRTVHQVLKVPVGLIQASAGGSKATDWIPVDGIESQFPYDVPVERTKHVPGLLYHIRLRGVTRLAVRGAIWYQGEDDGRNLQYARDLTRLVTTWRRLFRDDSLPFYMAQIGATSYASGMLAVYEAQQAVVNRVPHTAIAVSNDIYADHLRRLAAQESALPDDQARQRHRDHIAGLRKRLFRVDEATGWPLHGMSNPHPPNKELVATRLGRIALARTYRIGEAEVCGPMFDGFRVDGARILVKFRNVGTGLRTGDGRDPVWFEIAEDRLRPGKGRRTHAFVKASAHILDRDTVELRADGVERPAHARFAWHMYARHNLVNSAGLPALPFRTVQTYDPRWR